MERRLLIVKNIPKACTKDTIENYLEVVCDNGVDDVDFYDERATHIALVTFTEPLIDISTLKKNVARRKLEGEHVELKAVSAPQGVIVTQLPKTLTEDTLQFYFENKKSGGRDDGVDDCTLYRKLKCAVVTFTSPDIARNVLAVKSHTPVKNQPPVKLEPFYKGYQDEVIKFLSDLHPPGASGDDDLDSGGDKSQDEQSRKETECSIKEKIEQFQVPLQETSTAVRARQSDYEFVQIRSISGRDSHQSKEKFTSVNIPRMEDGQAVMSYHVPPKREDQGMVSINIKEKKDDKIYDTIDDDAVEMRNTSKSKRTEQNKPPTAPKPKRSSMNPPSESSEERNSDSVKFDSANVRLLEKMHLFEDDFPTCSIKYKSSTGEITITGPKSKLPDLKLKMFEENNRITKDSCHLHQAAIDLISRDKGKRFVEDELKEVKESIWFIEGQKCVCLTFSETETKTMIAKVKSLVHHETVPYNESHFKYINGTQWKDLVQKLEQEHLVKILVDRSKKQVKVEGLGKDTAQCRDRVQQEINSHSHKAGEFTAKGAHARCLKGNFDKDLQEVRKIIMDSDTGGSWNETGGQFNLHLKFEGDPKCVKKVEAEMKKLEKKVWHERLHLKEVSKETHVNLLIRGIHRNNMSAYQAAFESQHSVYLDMNLPGAPKIMEAVQEAFQSRPPFKHARSAPSFGEQEEDDDDNDNDNDNEEDDEDGDVKELQVFSDFKARSSYTPPSRRGYGPPRRSSPQRQQNTSLTHGNVTLTVSKGDVSKETVDVFVNVVPKNLDLTGTAVSQAYAKAGGTAFQQQFEASKPMWKPGSILQTNCSGNLNGQMVYTFVLEKWNPHHSKKELSSLIDTCLKTAEGNGYTSIALTSFGCGRLFRFPEKYVASCLVKAVKANSAGNLQKVSIVIYDHATYQAFLDEIDPPSFTLRHSRTMPDLNPFDRYPSSDSITVGPTTISVEQGDITKAKGTVLVNPISEDLNFGVTAVAQALARAAGTQLIQEFESEKDSPTGNIIVTTGAKLNCKFVYHVILKKNNARGSGDYKSRIRECFKLAARHNTQSMVFPAIGCGMLFKYPDNVVASTLIEEAKKSNIPSVTFMIYDQQTVKTFLRELGGGNSEEEEEDTSGNFSTLRKFAKDFKSDKVPKADNKSANIVVYGASKDICTKARSKLSQQLKQDFLQEKEITNENLLRFKGKTLSKMKNMAERNGIWIKFPDPDKKKHKDTPTLKLMGEKNAVLLVTAEIQDLLLKEVTKSIPRPRKLQGARGSMKLIDEMAEMSEFLPPAYWKNNQSSGFFKLINKLKGAAPPTNGLVDVDKATFNAIDKVIQTTWDSTLVGHGKDAVNLTHQNIKVKQIQRLENPDMFRLYSQKRSAMFRSARNQGGPFTPIKSLPGSKYAVRTTQSAPPELQREIFPEVNEHYLFHGTKMENIQAIMTHGLDPRVGGKGMFGSGVYGAESSTKADQYTDDKKNRTTTDKQMLLMRVVMGQPLVSKTPKDYCRPPCKDLHHLDDKCNQQNHGLFDSVIADGTWNFREFVVYAGDVCYPEYVITYTRV